MVYIFSDGFQDQFGGEKGKKYRSTKFRNFLHSVSDKSTDEQKELIEQEFTSWLGDYEQIDDVCVMGVQNHLIHKLIHISTFNCSKIFDLYLTSGFLDL